MTGTTPLSTLSERLAKHIEPCEALAASFPLLPTLIAVPLPNGPSLNEFVTLQLPLMPDAMPIAFAEDGGIKGKTVLPRGYEFLAQSATTFSDDSGKHSFGLIVFNKIGVQECRENLLQWKKIAASIAPVLWSYPETGLASLSNPSSAVLAFVFRWVYGTPFVSLNEECLIVHNLWGATLFALANCQPVKSELKSTPPQPSSYAADLSSLTVDQALRALKDDDRTSNWPAQQFAKAIGRSKSAVIQSDAWKEIQRERNDILHSQQNRYRSNEQ